jgi:hypothetical protein
MPTPPISRAEAHRRIDAIEQALREGGTAMGVMSRRGERSAVRIAFDRLGLRQSVDRGSIQKIEQAAGRLIDWSLSPDARISPDAARKPRFDPPTIPADDVPVEQLIEQLSDRFARRAENAAAKRWMRYALHDAGPYLLAFVGDPHLDDNGCNWPLLRRDVDLMRTPHVHGVMLGDVTNNWAGKLQRLYANQDVTRDRAWKLAEWYFQTVPWLMLLKGNHDCLDIETEALTRRGWLRHEEITDSDEVLSIDPATGSAVWSPILMRVTRENTEEMVSIQTRTIDMRVTPNHRVLHKERSLGEWGEWKYSRADILPATFRIPVAAISGNDDAQGLSDDEIALAGWVLTDGGIRMTGNCPQVTIYQSKPSPDLEGILARLDLEHRVAVRHREVDSVCGRPLVSKPLPQREYKFSADAGRRIVKIVEAKGRLPSWAQALSDRQFEILLAALIAGDGSWFTRGGRKNCAVLHGNKDFLDSVQACAVAHGWQAHLSVAREKDWRLNLCRKTEWMAHRSAVVKREAPSPAVWCLTVPLSNFMVRRRGKSYFTGNCWSQSHGQGDPLDWMARGAAGLEDWSARFEVAAGEHVVRIWASHDFKGQSMYNPLHGQMRAHRFSAGEADILAAGHQHHWEIFSGEDADKGSKPHWLIRARGYKHLDPHADRHQYPQQQHGATIAVVVDPSRDGPAAIQCYADLAEAVEILGYKRARWEASCHDAKPDTTTPSGPKPPRTRAR